MINLIKKKPTDIKEEFTIGDYDFSIDHGNSIVKIDGNKIIDLTIKADDNVFDKLCENDGFEFNFGLYSPEFYARGVDLGRKRQIIINQENGTDIECALYFMEHNDVKVNLSIHDNWILVAGWTDIMGKEYPILIKLKNKNYWQQRL